MTKQRRTLSHNWSISHGMVEAHGIIKQVWPLPVPFSQTNSSHSWGLSFHTVIIALLLIQPIHSYAFISLESIWLAEKVKLLSASLTDSPNIFQTYNNSFEAASHRREFSPTNQTGNQIRQNNDMEYFSQEKLRSAWKFHTFIYPYKVYEVKNMSFKELHELMAKPVGDQASANKSSFINKNASQNHIDGPLSFNSSFLIPHMFLLQKITSCTTAQVCFYLSLLPNNLAFAPQNTNENLNFLKVGPSQFVLQSIYRSEIQQGVLNLSQIEGKQKENKVSIDRSKVYFFSLNINVFIFSKINQQHEFLTLGFQILFPKFKVFQILGNEDASWDVAHNGSSFRFIKLRKEKISKSPVGGKQQNWNEKKRVKQSLKRQNQTIQLRGESSSGEGVINILHMVQHSIQIYQDSKHYFVKFYSSQLPQHNAIKREGSQQHLSSNRKTMIGLTKNNFFLIFSPHFTSRQTIVRIFFADLHRLQLLQQMVNSKDQILNSFIGKVKLEVRDNFLLQFQNGQPKLKHSPKNDDGQFRQNYSSTEQEKDCDYNEKVERTCQGLGDLERSTFLNDQAYKDIQRFRYLHACRLMESKLKTMLREAWNETAEQQQKNCWLQWSVPQNIVDQTGNSLGKYPERISFRKPQKGEGWSVCRIGIDTGDKNLVISALEFPLRPYLFFRCSLKNSVISKCSYHEWLDSEHSPLPQNSKSVLFIVNQGQTYDLNISDITSAGMDQIAQSFLIIFLSLCTVASLFICMILCRPAYLILCIRLGLARPEAEPSFRYPLNCLQLRFKLHSMESLGVIRWTWPENLGDEQDDCIFCLSSKSHDALVEIYCSHSYHRDCFQEWVKQEKGELSCPICKRKLNSQGLQAYQQQNELIL